MTDFVTRLESELHAAALRRESAGAVRSRALPRMRLALGELPTAALATVLLGLAVAAAAIMLESSPEHAARAKLPPALQGSWRAGQNELRLYRTGAPRCTNLGLESAEPCYTLGGAHPRVAQEWGEVSVAGDKLTLRSVAGGEPGSYRWVVTRRELRLSKLRDSNAARADALVSQPLVHPRPHRERPVPIDWSARVFTSDLYGYTIRYPGEWSARQAPAAGRPDRLSPRSPRSALPAVSLTAEDVKPGTTKARWSVIVESEPQNDCGGDEFYRDVPLRGATARVTDYSCHGADQQWASFVHEGRGYRVVWRGKVGTNMAAHRRFDALLRSIIFPR